MESPNEQRKKLENMFKEMIDVAASIGGSMVSRAYLIKLRAYTSFSRKTAGDIVGAVMNRMPDIRGAVLFSDVQGEGFRWKDPNTETWFADIKLAAKHPVIYFSVLERGISYGISCEWKLNVPNGLFSEEYHQYLHYRIWFTSALNDEQVASYIRTEIGDWRHFALNHWQEGLVPQPMPEIECIKAIPVQQKYGFNCLVLLQEIEELQKEIRESQSLEGHC